jgi:hypothetical protein
MQAGAEQCNLKKLPTGVGVHINIGLDLPPDQQSQNRPGWRKRVDIVGSGGRENEQWALVRRS